MTTTKARPTIALAMGDPCGISAELAAKLMADPAVTDAANLIVVGDRRVLAEGEQAAGTKVAYTVWRPGDAQPAAQSGTLFVDLGHLDPKTVTRGVSSREGGVFALTNFRTALRLGAAGAADAVTYVPFNKHAMKLALPSYVDEIEVITEETGAKENGREFNILDKLWNARVTSHVPLKDVAKYITHERVLDSIMFTDQSMRQAGIAKPRIAVAALNPHAGDQGNFGREEIDVLAPAVAAAKAKGIACEGPFPCDTVFLRAKRGDFDAVQTMYHDQGQIAMKMMGFERGITLIAGYKFPVCTPAHGTAYDIAGKGIANVGGAKQAMLIAASMAKPAALGAAERFDKLRAVVDRTKVAA